MKISSVIKNTVIIGITAGTLTAGATKVCAAPQSNQDKVELRYKVKPSGSFEEHILKNAPKPNLIFKGEEKIAKFVVDVTNNILYHYNQLGEAVGVYSVATENLQHLHIQAIEWLLTLKHIHTKQPLKFQKDEKIPKVTDQK